MIKARGLLNLEGPYLKEMEIECPSAGTRFLALITQGGAANVNNISINNPIRAPPPRPSPKQGQGLEDRRFMNRFGKDHEARKIDTFLLRQQIQQLIPIFPLQESWATFIVGPLPKLVTTLDGKQDLVDDLLLQESGLASIRHEIPVRQVAWTNRSKESTESTGHIIIHIPEHKAHKFPSRLQLFGLAMDIQRIRERKAVHTCEKCHGFQSTRICARQEKDLSLLNLTDIYTHNQSDTLDLAFCSPIDTKCEVPLDLHTTLDHETLLTSIPLRATPLLQTLEDIENEADNITQTIHNAFLAACPRASSKKRGTTWWNGECKDAAFRYRQARRTSQSNYKKRELWNAVRWAKREYWKSRVKKLDTLPEVYKIAYWHNTAPKHHTPPLEDPNDETEVFCPKKKMELFRRLNRLLTPVVSHGIVIVRWIPGHADTTGNERADSLAKSVCNELTLRIKASISRVTRLLNE
ncbi:hypothetical protein EPUL_000189, partial [Erysiphe pulchra]